MYVYKITYVWGGPYHINRWTHTWNRLLRYKMWIKNYPFDENRNIKAKLQHISFKCEICNWY